MRSETRYAKSGDVSIAYQVVGEGPRDLVLVFGFVSHVEIQWEAPAMRRFLEHLSAFTRLILFDKRGTGLSDPVDEVPTLEQRMDDVRAVMDAVGSKRAALFGISEGAPLSVLFAATHPDRATALILHGGMARSTWAPDYPWATPKEDLLASAIELVAPHMADAGDLEVWSPSVAEDPATVEYMKRFRRYAASPGAVQKLFMMFLDIDVRDVLPLVQAPTLVLHRRGDRVVNRRAGRHLADHIPGARYVELPGQDHMPWVGDADRIVDEISTFLTGAPQPAEPDRVLATVMFTDIVGSTERAAEMGDAGWRPLLEQHDALVREQLDRFRGREVKTMGDGFLATFDGPARAVRCGLAIRDAVRALDLEVRVGVHTGECEVMGADIGGIAVNIASRIGDIAEASEVLVSRTVKDLVAGSGLAFDERGRHTLRGVPDEWDLLTAADPA